MSAGNKESNKDEKPHSLVISHIFFIITMSTQTRFSLSHCGYN